MINADLIMAVFNGIKLHFNAKDYDYTKYGPKRATKETLDKNYVVLSALSRKFNSKEELENRLIGIFKSKNIWLTEIFDPESKKLFNEHVKNVQFYKQRFREDLKLLINDSANLPDICSSCEKYELPMVCRYLIKNQITMESFVCLDIALDFNNSLNSLVWKERGLRLRKYRSFFNPDRKEILKIIKEVFAENSLANKIVV